MGKKKAWPPRKNVRMAYMCFASIEIKPFFLILPEGSAKLPWAGRGQSTSYFIASMVQWIEKSLSRGRPEFDSFIYFRGSNKKQRSCDGRGGAQRHVWLGNEPKKTGARSARARTRGQNLLVWHIHIDRPSNVLKCTMLKIPPSATFPPTNFEFYVISKMYYCSVALHIVNARSFLCIKRDALCTGF